MSELVTMFRDGFTLRNYQEMHPSLGRSTCCSSPNNGNTLKTLPHSRLPTTLMTPNYTHDSQLHSKLFITLGINLTTLRTAYPIQDPIAGAGLHTMHTPTTLRTPCHMQDKSD